MPYAGDMTMNPKMWTILPDPCFDPYGDISEWTEQDSVDLQSFQTPEKGSESLISPR